MSQAGADKCAGQERVLFIEKGARRQAKMSKGVDSYVRAPKALIKCSSVLPGDKEMQILH